MSRITIVVCLFATLPLGCAQVRPNAEPHAAQAQHTAATVPEAAQSVIMSADKNVGKIKPPSGSGPVKIPAPVNPIASAPKQAVAAKVREQPPMTSALDLMSLERRLRNTHAIGVFAKLSLKNQVDDLLEQFRGFYKGTIRMPLAALRQRYDLLMLKVLALLQDRDPPLAANIGASREAIWRILADPVKFATI